MGPVGVNLLSYNTRFESVHSVKGRNVLFISRSEATGKAVWPQERHPVTIALSEDGGISWPWIRDIDMGDGFRGDANRHLNRQDAYPCITQTGDGLIHVAYSYRGRKCIKYVRFTEEWIRGQM